MGAHIDYTARGLFRMTTTFRRLPATVQADVARAGLQAGARFVAARARRTTRFRDRSGELRRSIRAVATVRGRDGRFRRAGTFIPFAIVRMGSERTINRGFQYARAVEFGTRLMEARHVIRDAVFDSLPLLPGVMTKAMAPVYLRAIRRLYAGAQPRDAAGRFVS